MSVAASHDSPDSAAQRRVMVDRQVHTFDVTDAALLARMLDLPREPFLPDRCKSFAYSDSTLEVSQANGESRRVLTPMVLARMIQATRARPTDRALDVAGGGGYGAGLLAGLCATAIAVECVPELTERASRAFLELEIAGARATTGALTDGGGESGAFDVILVEGGALEQQPDGLLSLLADGGRLAAIYKPVHPGGSSTCLATLWTRSGATFGRAPLFNAPAQVLSAFSKRPTFAF
jgi:protein-L-isoaspartate(D-aspartate) O-methyltransferase